jgi:hypothetical protein
MCSKQYFDKEAFGSYEEGASHNKEGTSYNEELDFAKNSRRLNGKWPLTGVLAGPSVNWTWAAIPTDF